MYESVKNVIMSCNTAVTAPLKDVLCNFFLPRKHRHKRVETGLYYNTFLLLMFRRCLQVRDLVASLVFADEAAQPNTWS